jgi:hypothetical protein
MQNIRKRKSYPRKGTLLKKLQFLDENHFKTIWRLDHLIMAFKKRKEKVLIKNLRKELDALSDAGVLFRISLRKKTVDTYYTFNVKWEFENGVPIGKIHKPRHKDFIREVFKCKSWHIHFSGPPLDFMPKTSGSVLKMFETERCEFVEG